MAEDEKNRVTKFPVHRAVRSIVRQVRETRGVGPAKAVLQEIGSDIPELASEIDALASTEIGEEQLSLEEKVRATADIMIKAYGPNLSEVLQKAIELEKDSVVPQFATAVREEIERRTTEG